MPALTIDQLVQKAQALEKQLTEKGEGMEPAKRRGVKKQLKRAQRKCRRLNAEAQRLAPKPKEEKSE